MTGETDRTAGEDGGASPPGLRSRGHGSRRRRDRTQLRPSGEARVGVKISARAGVESGHGGRLIPCLPGAHGAAAATGLIKPKNGRRDVPVADG